MSRLIDERQLVKDLQAGNREAFERLLDLCENRIYNLACRMVGPGDVEDVAQDALVEICRCVRTFRGNSSLNTWIHRVAVNVCLEHRRKRKLETSPLEDELTEEIPAFNPADAVVKKAMRSELDTAINALPDIHKDVVVLHELQGFTYHECAEILGCPVGTVKSRLSNAFAKLREMLKDCMSESEAAL